MSSDESGRVRFLKGQGTGNDFVLLPDPDGRLDLTPARVRALCDRRFGIGADGVLRVVRSALDAEAERFAGAAEYFMDYRNADGSVSEMCGNGIRVFARYLVEAGLAAPGRLPIATRGGVLVVDVAADGRIAVEMGRAEPGAEDATVTVGARTWAAVPVRVPNPHAVVFLDDGEPGDDLGSLDLSGQPLLAPAAAFPESANVEFVRTLAPGHIAMRVHERGVGETLSCGTGAVAAAWAAMQRAVDVTAVQVDVPGGTLHVQTDGAGRLSLSGPAEIVADGVVRDGLWAARG